MIELHIVQIIILGPYFVKSLTGLKNDVKFDYSNCYKLFPLQTLQTVIYSSQYLTDKVLFLQACSTLREIFLELVQKLSVNVFFELEK